MGRADPTSRSTRCATGGRPSRLARNPRPGPGSAARHPRASPPHPPQKAQLGEDPSWASHGPPSGFEPKTYVLRGPTRSSQPVPVGATESRFPRSARRSLAPACRPIHPVPPSPLTQRSRRDARVRDPTPVSSSWSTAARSGVLRVGSSSTFQRESLSSPRSMASQRPSSVMAYWYRTGPRSPGGARRGQASALW